jgi:hypothetical protein
LSLPDGDRLLLLELPAGGVDVVVVVVVIVAIVVIVVFVVVVVVVVHFRHLHRRRSFRRHLIGSVTPTTHTACRSDATTMRFLRRGVRPFPEDHVL